MSHHAHTMLVAARRAIAVLGVFAIIMASLAHACGHRETLSGNSAVVASLSADLAGGVDLPEGNTVSGHHCAACVGIAFPKTIEAETVDMIASAVVFGALQRHLEPHGPALHTPPPKQLT